MIWNFEIGLSRQGGADLLGAHSRRQHLKPEAASLGVTGALDKSGVNSPSSTRL